MKIVRTILFVVFVIWVLFVIFGNVSVKSQINNQQPAGDSNCQYPDRQTNPEAGCDNTDPACPETIKQGYDCQLMGSSTQAEEISMSHNIITEGK